MATTTSTSILMTFDNIFHELNDELEKEANDWHLNKYYINFENEIQDKQLTQLSTSQEVSTISKKKPSKDNDHQFFHEIPDYLIASSVSFQVAFFSELRSYYNPIDFQDLQQLAFLTHQMSIIHLHEQLWRCFLQSGTGQLKQRLKRPTLSHADNITLSFWPKIVTSVMIVQGIKSDNARQDKIDQDIYVNFVQNYLNQLETKANQCRLQFNTIKNRLPNYVDIFNDKLDHFIQNEDLLTIRLHLEMIISLTEYICMDRSYQLEYFQQKPTNLQLEIVKHICQITLEKEKTEQELILFKFGSLYKKFPKALDILESSLPTSITTISDSVIRERLSSQYIRIIQQAKADLMRVLRSAAEAKKIDCEKKFNQETAEIWKKQRQLSIEERLSTTMLSSIEERQKNIVECVKHIHHLKGSLFLKITPTTTVII